LNETAGRWPAELNASKADAATSREDLDERLGRWNLELAAGEADGAVAWEEVSETCTQFQHQVQEQFTSASGENLLCTREASTDMMDEDWHLEGDGHVFLSPVL